jgi:hypothetical protein
MEEKAPYENMGLVDQAIGDGLDVAATGTVPGRTHSGDGAVITTLPSEGLMAKNRRLNRVSEFGRQSNESSLMRMASSLLVLIWLGMFSVFSFAVESAEAGAQSPLNEQQKGWLAKAGRHEKAGWIYLHVEGEPREIGFQHGYLLAPEIAECIRATSADWHHLSSMDWAWLIKHTNGFIKRGIDAELRAEMEGIAEGMTTAGYPATLDDIIAYNASIETTGYWWPEVAKQLTGGANVVTKPKQSCSSFVATGRMTRDGGVVLAHNTMGSYILAIAYVIIDLVPAKGHRILMQTQPGWIHSGSDFFITDAGLVGSETTIGGFHGFSEKGIPEFVRMRRATQDAGTLDEWCAIMKRGNNGGYANAWLLGDVNSGEIARLELGLKYTALERTRDGYFIGSNVAENLHILRLETDVKDEDIRDSSVARRIRWKQLMKENAGKIDVAKAKEMEADCYDVCLQKEYPGGRTLNSHGELEPDGSNSGPPFDPSGTFDAKAVDRAMAKRMSFAARWGSADGMAFEADKFLGEHPQFDWQTGFLKSRPAEPWVEFTAGEK